MHMFKLDFMFAWKKLGRQYVNGTWPIYKGSLLMN
jgi:hypothetical protein